MNVAKYEELMSSEPRTLAFWRDGISEFVATFCLVSVQLGLVIWSQPVDGPTTVSSVHLGLGMALVVVGIGWGLGDFGGGHMNPAITLAMMLCARITFPRGLMYWCFQVLGGIAGAAFIYGMASEVERNGNLGATLLSTEHVWQGALIEVWITAMLVLTALGATNSNRKEDGLFMPPLAIGGALGLGLLLAANRTGASMNPARSLGPAVIQRIWDDHWVYWVGPMGGAAIAAFIYQLLDLFGRPDHSVKSETYSRGPTPRPTPAVTPQLIRKHGGTEVRRVTMHPTVGDPHNVHTMNSQQYDDDQAVIAFENGVNQADATCRGGRERLNSPPTIASVYNPEGM